MVLCELAHTLLLSYFFRVRAQSQMASTAIPLVIFIYVCAAFASSLQTAPT